MEIDKDVGWYETKEHIFNLAPNQKTMRIRLFRSERENLKYIDDGV